MATTQTVVLRLELQAAALERKLSATERRLKGFEGRTKAMSAQVRSHLTGMFAVGALVAFGRAQIELITKIDASNRALKAITGTSLEYARAKGMLRQSAEEFGVSILDLTASYVRFYAASKSSTLSTNELDDVFNKMTKSSAVLGLSADETAGVLKALEQMFSKNKIQAEELRGQLGDRLPGAFVIMAKSMGVTTAELDKMLKAGTVMSDEVLPNFAREYEKAVGADQEGKIKTLRSEFGRFNTAWIQLIESIDSADGALSGFVKGATDWVVIMAGLNDDTIDFWSDFLLNGKSTAEIADVVRAKYAEQTRELERTANVHNAFIVSLVSGYMKAGKSVDDFIADQSKIIPMALTDDGKYNDQELIEIYALFEKLEKERLDATKKANEEAYEAWLKIQDEKVKKLHEIQAIEFDEWKWEQGGKLKAIQDEIDLREELIKVLEVAAITDSDVDDFMGSLKSPAEEVADEADVFPAWMTRRFEHYTEYVDRMKDFSDEIHSIEQGIWANAFVGIGEAIGRGENLFDAVLGVFAKGLSQLGQAMITYGVQMLVMKKSIKSLNPYLAIAAGTALVAAGAAMSKKNASVMGGSSSGGGASGGRSEGFGNSVTGQSIQFDGEFVIRGRDLVYVLGQNSNKDGRVKTTF